EKKRRDEKKKASRKKAQEEGRWQDLISDAEKERDDAFKERDEARDELVSFKKKVLVTEAAQSVGFKDPTDAFHYLPDDFEDYEEKDLLERALKRILRDKDYLKDNRRATGVGG